MPVPWHCPVDDCWFTTDVKRARSAHLLRSHHLLFRGRGLDPVPLAGDELHDRLEAFRRRNRGIRQRARENRREAADEGPASRDCRSKHSTLAPEPVVGSFADIAILDDEDWAILLSTSCCYWRLTLQMSLFLPMRLVTGTPPRSLLPGRIGWWCLGCRHHLPRSKFCPEVSPSLSLPLKSPSGKLVACQWLRQKTSGVSTTTTTFRDFASPSV